MKNIIFSTDFDNYFFNLEQHLWNCQPSIEFSKIMNQGWFNEIMNICYFSYYILTMSICIILYYKNPTESYKSIFIIIFSFYLYYIIFALFPVVGPQYYIQNTGLENMPPHFFGKLMNQLLTNFERPTGAFPSSHVGVALIISYLSFKHLKKLFYISLPFVFGICFATVYLKEHYLVDILAGIVSAPLFILFSSFIYNKFLSVCTYETIRKFD